MLEFHCPENKKTPWGKMMVGRQAFPVENSRGHFLICEGGQIFLSHTKEFAHEALAIIHKNRKIVLEEDFKNKTSVTFQVRVIPVGDF